jgi:putative copper resistance protein D
VVFASLPLHAFFGVVLMGTREVLGGTFYRSLHLSWHTDLPADQRLVVELLGLQAKYRW